MNSQMKEALELLEDAYVKIDMQQETIDEQANRIRILEGLLALKQQDNRFVVGDLDVA